MENKNNIQGKDPKGDLRRRRQLQRIAQANRESRERMGMRKHDPLWARRIKQRDDELQRRSLLPTSLGEFLSSMEEIAELGRSIKRSREEADKALRNPSDEILRSYSQRKKYHPYKRQAEEMEIKESLLANQRYVDEEAISILESAENRYMSEKAKKERFLRAMGIMRERGQQKYAEYLSKKGTILVREATKAIVAFFDSDIWPAVWRAAHQYTIETGENIAGDVRELISQWGRDRIEQLVEECLKESVDAGDDPTVESIMKDVIGVFNAEVYWAIQDLDLAFEFDDN